MPETSSVLLEAGTRHDFIAELATVPGGERVRDCIQCGTCSGSCPVAHLMDNPPRKLLAMIRAGLRDEVLRSRSLWLCSSCYTCTERCPRQIAVTDLMYALKRLALRENRVPEDVNAAVFVNTFAHGIERRGRNSETAFLMRYYLSVDPGAMLGQAPLGLRLFTRGRFPLLAEHIKRRKELRAILAKAKEMGEL
jgi:quinone-modifying oxidoreductase, subunit QmoC